MAVFGFDEAKNFIEAIPKSDIIDNLNSNSTDKPLSANQGRLLSSRFKIDEIARTSNDDWTTFSCNKNDYDIYILISTTSGFSSLLGSTVFSKDTIVNNNEISAFYAIDTQNYECKVKFISDTQIQTWTKTTFDGCILVGVKIL